MSDAHSTDNHTNVPLPRTAGGVAALKPKGACWYCNHPLDNIRKFCNKTCADDYRTEEEAFSTDPE